MVVLTSNNNLGNGASYQTNSPATDSAVKAMNSSGLKTKSPLLEKSAAHNVKLVPLKRSNSVNNNSNSSILPMTNASQTPATATDGDGGKKLPPQQPLNGLTKKSASEVTQTEVNSPAAAAAVAAVPPKRRKGRPPKSALTLKASAKAKNAAAKSPATQQSKVLLDNVIPFITCNLCKGYLVDATTIVECLHTFCHSCIMIHLRQKQYCPCCELMINKTKPNIKPDAIRQAIVYKLVPGLYEKEILRRQEFYRAHPEDAKVATPEQRGEDTENLIFSPSENISLSVEYADIEETSDLDGVWKEPKYLLCPASFTVSQLSKFVVMKIGMDANKFLVDISYKVKTIVLADYYTLMDVAYIYTWKREAPMRFFFSVRTKETTHQELPEVPFRRSPGILANSALPPLIVNSSPAAAGAVDVNTSKDNATSDKNSASEVSSPAAATGAAGETKLKLVKKVDESPRVSDKKRVVYMVQSPDNGPQISAAAAYNLLPHESTAVGVHSATPPTTPGSQLSSKSVPNKQQPLQPQQTPTRTSEEATPRYRSLVEKENAKMKKLMQSLSEEKKLLKLRKREAMKEAAAVSPIASLKMKITKSDTGLLVIQNSAATAAVQDLKDPLSSIVSVASCDVNDENKKAMFLQAAFKLAPKKSIAEKVVEPKKTITATEMKKSISFGFSSYEFDRSEEDKDVDIPPLRSSTPKATDAAVKQTPSPSSPSPTPSEKSKNKSVPTLKRSASDEKLTGSRKKVSSYVKIAPKEMVPPKIQPKLAPKSPAAHTPENVGPQKPPTNRGKQTANSLQMGLSVMAPPPAPTQQQPPPQRPPPNGSIYAFLQPNPSPKTLFKPGPGCLQNMPTYSHSQFQTMPSPVYMTNANAGSTPIYSPNSPQYAPNFSLPPNQQFKYTKFPTYMTNFTMPGMPMTAPSTQPAPQNPTSQNSPKVPELVAGKTKKDQKVTTANANKGISYLNKLPPPPIFSASSGMSITTTTVGSAPPPLAAVVLPKRSPPAPGAETVSAGKRKNTSSPSCPAKTHSPTTGDDDPPEKQRKVQSLLDSCNITFPSSLSITIANESDDSDKSGLHNNKLKNPVNNYIEILKIPSGDPANCPGAAVSSPSPSTAAAAPEQNNKFSLSVASAMHNPGTFTTSASSEMKPPTPPITTNSGLSTSGAMKLGSAGGYMSITPAIATNMMHLIKGNGPKDAPSPVELKRKSPPIEVKRPSPSPPQFHVRPVTSTAAAPVEAKKAKTAVPKLMPKLNPIEKVVPPNNKNATPTVAAAVVAAKPTAPANLGVAAAAAAAITSAKETFQREFLRFAKDKPEPSSTANPTKGPIKSSSEGNKALVGQQTEASPKVQRKSPVKIKPKSAGQQQQQKIQPAPNNRPQPLMNAPPAIAPFPLASQQHQQRQQQEFAAAALFKMMLDSQHQQKIAALRQSQFPTVLGDLMLPNPMAAAAYYQEQLERMKQAGKEALEQYAQNIQQEANGKQQLNSVKGKGTSKAAAQMQQSPVVKKEEGKKSPPKIIVGNNRGTSAEEANKKSPKPLQLNNNNQSPVIKQEDKKDVKA